MYEEISNSGFQIKVLKHKLRLSILFIFRHCFMLPFPPYTPYPILLIALIKCYACRFLCKNFFLRITARRSFFFRQVHLARIFFWELSHLRLFLMVRPLLQIAHLVVSSMIQGELHFFMKGAIHLCFSCRYVLSDGLNEQT